MPSHFFSSRAISVISFIILPISLVGYYLKETYDSNILFSLQISIGMFWSAMVLYWLKKRDQFWYGVLEIIFASITLFYSIIIYAKEHSWDQTTFDEFLKRAALIYLLVRGIGNIDDGVKKNFWLEMQVKPYYEKFLAFLFNR